MGQFDHNNLYQYAFNDPVNAIDPNGEQAVFRAVRRFIGRGLKKYYETSGPISLQAARKRRLRGKDVEVGGRGAEQAAKDLENWVSRETGKRRPVRHSPHHDTSPIFKPHYQTPGHDGHTFLDGKNTLLLLPAADSLLPEPVGSSPFDVGALIDAPQRPSLFDALFNWLTDPSSGSDCKPRRSSSAPDGYGEIGWAGGLGALNRR